MSDILKTNDYSIFKKHENNRSINNTSLQSLIASIQYKNLLEFRPVLVDSFMRVLDGQHRIEACKKLGLDVYYQIQESVDDNDIILLNANQAAWRLVDFIDYWYSKGKEEFITLRQFCEHNKLAEIDVLRYCMGAGFALSRKVKSGVLKLTKEDLEVYFKNICEVDDLIKTIKMYIPPSNTFFKSQKVKMSLFLFIKRSGVDLNTFKNKLRYKVELLLPCTDTNAYCTLFTNIYNWKNQSPI